MSTRAAIVSRRPLVRGLLAEWLRSKLAIETIIEASGVDPAIAARCAEADILLLDASDCTVFATIDVVRYAAPAIRVIIVAGGQGDYVLHRATLAGATGVVHEADNLDILAAAIATVTSGGVYHSASVVQRRTTLPLMKTLTSRELMVLEHACAGLADEDTAKALGCATATVETHRRNLMRKINAGDWGELIVLGIRLGVVSADRVTVGSGRRRTSVRRKLA